MKVIWKHKIRGANYEFDAPSGAQPIHARVEQAIDGQQPVLYFLCERLSGPAKHSLSMFATGAHIPPEAGSYAGTVTMNSPDTGNLVVVHIFHKQLEVITPS